MNKKLLVLLATILSASFYSCVGATNINEKNRSSNSTALVKKENAVSTHTINTSTKERNGLITQTIQKKNAEKGYTVTIGLDSGCKPNFETELYFNILFKALEEQMRKDLNIKFYDFIKNVRIESLVYYPNSSMQGNVVSFEILSDAINGERLNEYIKEFVKNSKIGIVRKKFKEIAENYYKDVDIEKIKNDFKGKIDNEIIKLKQIKNNYSNNFGFGGGFFGNFHNRDSLINTFNSGFYNMLNFGSIFNNFFTDDNDLYAEEQEIRKKAFNDTVNAEIEKMEENKRKIDSLEKNDELLKKINETVDLLQGKANIGEYSFVSKSFNSITTNDGNKNLLT